MRGVGDNGAEFLTEGSTWTKVQARSNVASGSRAHERLFVETEVTTQWGSRGKQARKEGESIRRGWKSVEKGLGVAKFVFPPAQSDFMIEQGVQGDNPEETWHDWVSEGWRPERNTRF